MIMNKHFFQMMVMKSRHVRKLDIFDEIRRNFGSVILYESDIIYSIDYKNLELLLYKNRYDNIAKIEFGSLITLLKRESDLKKKWQSEVARVIKIVKLNKKEV